MDPFAIILGIFIIGLIVMVIMMMFMPRIRSKAMYNQMKTAKNLFLENTGSFKALTEATIDLEKQILEENGEKLKEINAMKADIESAGIEKKAAAVKRGFAKDEEVKEETPQEEPDPEETPQEEVVVEEEKHEEVKEEKKEIVEDENTKRCPYCEAVIEADSIFCKECGKKQ